MCTPVSCLSQRKQRIAQHFAHATHYEQHAHIQQQVCQQLLTLISNHAPKRILEVGAGGGQLTRLLTTQLTTRLSTDAWHINELTEAARPALDALLPDATLHIGDAETMDLGTGYDLITSANAIQWFDNPLSFVTQSAARLTTGGQLLFSTFTPNNFMQIKTLLGQGLHYPSISEWQQALNNAGLTDMKLHTERFELHFDSPYAVLKHMKLTGVSTNTPDKPFVWNKARLAAFERDYWAQFGQVDGDDTPYVPLTYEALILSAYQP